MANKNSNGKRNNGRNAGCKRSRCSESPRAPKRFKDTSTNYDTGAEGSNNPGWYSKDAALLKDAASIPFSWAMGTPIDLDAQGTLKPYTIPGLMVFRIAPTFGSCTEPNDALNVAATSIYSFVRHANSGHSNYDAPDLMLYLTAMTQVYSYINYLQRVYGIASLYAQKNRYLPKALIEAQNIDFDSIYNNLANFRYGINLLINKAASLAVPATMPIFLRQAFLYQNVYCEGPSIKDQLYMFIPHGFYKFVWDSSTSAGELQFMQMRDIQSGTKYTYDELLEYGKDLLDQILQDEDMNIMSGDILKAYGGNIIKVASLPENYPLIPLYNVEVLEQMKNATVVYPKQLNGLGVKQSADKGYLISQPYLKASSDSVFGVPTAIQTWALAGYNWKQILSTAVAEPTPEVVMEDTRLMTPTTTNKPVTVADGSTGFPLACGTEVVAGCYYHYYRYDNNVPTFASGVMLSVFSVLEPNAASALWNVCKAGNFKYHPRMMVEVLSQISGENVGKATIESFFDVDNYAVLDSQTIDKMHETALLSMLDVAHIAKVQ